MNNLQIIAERVIPPMHFAMITTKDIAVIENEVELWKALIHRSKYECVIFASADIDILHCLVRQNYVPYWYQSISNDEDVPRLKIHINESKYFAIQDDSCTLNHLAPLSGDMITTQTLIDRGYWSVSGLNGFYVAKNINEVIYMVSGNRLKVPIANWHGNFDKALIEARAEYVRRFYQRYDFRYERISWLPFDEDGYIDEAFESREQRWKANKQINLFTTLYENGY